MRTYLLAGFIVAWTAGAQPQPGKGVIEGRVVSSPSGAPLRRATVTLTAPQIRLTDNTDAGGKFQFSGLPAGAYRLSAERTGFLERAARHPVTLSPDERVMNAEIRLPALGAITGHVLDDGGEPVDGAQVSVLGQSYRYGRKKWGSANRNAVANDTGEYRISNLRPGRYLVCAQDVRPASDNHLGQKPTAYYVVTYFPNSLSRQQAAPVEVGAGAEVSGIDVRLFRSVRQARVHVRGKVTGAPPGSAISVWLGSVDGGKSGSTLAEPPDYAFAVEVEPAQYDLLAHVYSSEGPRAFGRGSLAVTGDISGVVIGLTPAPAINGRIRLPETAANVRLAGMRVSLYGPAYVGLSELHPDAAGKFTSAEPLWPDRYVVRVSQPPQGYCVQEMRLGDQDISPGEFENATNGQLEIFLSDKAGTISGTVTDAEGKPFQVASVTLIPLDGKSWPQKQSADDAAHFQFTGLRPGSYKLFAWEELDDDLWQDPEFRKNYEDRGAAVTVGPKDTQNVQLRVIAAEEM